MAALIDSTDHVCDGDCDCNDHAHDHLHGEAGGDGGSGDSATSVVNDYTALLYYTDNDSLRWNGISDVGVPVVVTYSFTETADLEDASEVDSTGATDYWSFNQAQRDMFAEVTEQYEAVSGVIFVEVEGEAMINVFGMDGSSAGGWANIAQSYESYTSNGQFTNAYGNMDEGDYGYQVNLHELGHAMGLKHPHTGAVILDGSVDMQDNTVMTYNIEYPYTSDLGIFDIQAMQDIYGSADAVADWTVTVNADNVVKIVGSRNPDTIIGIDKGGVIKGGKGNDVVIGREGEDKMLGGSGKDDLFGGYGDDKLSGHKGDDELFGGSGDDVLKGHIGDDDLVGGDGDDRMFGGDGADTFVFSSVDRWDDDSIADFEQGADTIDLTATGMSFGNLSITTDATNTDLVIQGWSYSITLEDAAGLVLTADDFAFA